MSNVVPLARDVAVPKAKASFEGASGSRRLGHWAPMDAGPNAEIETTLGGLRARQRQQTRDNPTALSAREQWVINVIGNGLRPNLVMEDAALKDKILKLWNRSVQELDADGQSNFYGQQALLAHCMFDAGSCLVRRRFRKLEDGFAVPMQLQLIEPDHLDDTRDRKLENGGKVKLGIQLTPFGKREGYWLRREHPGDSFVLASGQSVFVPAEEIAHVFRVRRPGQLTGVPHLHAVLVAMYELDKYLDAELVRKQQAAMHVGVIENNTGEATPEAIWGNADTWATDRLGYYAEHGLNAGSWTVLAPGDGVKFNDPQDVGTNFGEFVATYKRDIAAAAGITYEQLTGKMTDVNYSSARVRLIDIRRGFEMEQRNVIAFQFCRKAWAWWLDAAVAAGRLKIPNYASEKWQYQPDWVPHPFDNVDPVKDLKADVDMVRAGLVPHDEMVMQYGGDPTKTYESIERLNELFDDRKFVFDTDGRHVTKTGTAQKLENDAHKENP